MADLLVGTNDGVHRLGERPGRDLPGHAVSALSPDAGHAVVDGAVWRLDPGGGWEPLARPDGREVTCLLAASRGLLAGTEGAHLLAGEGLEPLAAFDEVDGREKWYTPWGGPPATRSLTEDAGGNLYVNVHVGGVVGSADGGATWAPTGMDIHADAHQVLARPGAPGRVLAATAVGLGISDDAGASWAYETEGLHATYLRAVAVAGDAVLVSASEGHRGQRAALYRRPLGAAPGTPFEHCRAGLPEWFAGNIDTACLAASGPIAAFGTRDGAVYRSEDAGASWNLAAEGLAPVRGLVLA